MSERDSEGGGRLGFLDSLGRLFGAKQRAPASTPETPQATAAFARLEEDFEAAIQGLNQRVEEQRRAMNSATSAVERTRRSAEQRAADQKQRMDESHRAIGDDIEKMHGRLRTGLSRDLLDAIAAFLVELEGDANAGRDSQELIPRARYAIANRLRMEAGELTIARLVPLLERAGLNWPDPTHYRPTMTPEEVERSRRRRLSDIRESFVAQDLGRSAERMYGIVRGWGDDYPDRGSPLWEETVLTGVAAGIRGQLIQDFVQVLRDDPEVLLSQTEESIGKEIAALHGALESGVCSAEQARGVVASSLRVLDEVVPELAWEIVRARSPQARGEFPQQ